MLAVAAVALATLIATSACGAGGGASDSGSAAEAPGLPYGPNTDRGSPLPDGPVGGTPPEVNAAQQPLSTFALDVDTASFGYARRQLTGNRLPDPQTVRPEEFVNAFRQDYREPAGDGFAVSADGTAVPATHADEGLHLLRVGLQTRGETLVGRPDAALTFVIDVSGSMAEPGKLDLVQDALLTLVDQLRPTDRVAIVAYADRATVLRTMTPARDRAALRSAVQSLRSGGSTNLEAGITAGYELAREHFQAGATNRVILLSDGLPNVGNTTVEPILSQIREAAAKQISLLGVGVGSDYGDRFMERLADQGDGYVVYVSEEAQARKIFVEQLPAALAVRALDGKAQVEFDPAVVSTYRLIGYENRKLSASAFRDDRVDGGEVGPGHSVTALYAVRLTGAAASDATAATIRVRWQDPQTRRPSEQNVRVTVGGLSTPFAEAQPRLRMTYAAAFFAERLCQGRYGRATELEPLARIAEDAGRATGDRDVTELATLIRQAAQLGA